VGLLFQMVGGTLFIVTMLICCGSGLLNKAWATRAELQRIGWGDYSAARAMTICVAAGVFFGMATAAAGLGMQAENRRSPAIAVVVTFIATVFWGVHTIFAWRAAESWWLGAIALLLTIGFGVLFGFALAAASEMRRNPPPTGHDVLPADYKIPYSHYHPDPPEVRLAAELEQRRQKIAVQQKELEMLEEKLKKKLDEEKES
jgi:preprotein translocase subunit SecE